MKCLRSTAALNDVGSFVSGESQRARQFVRLSRDEMECLPGAWKLDQAGLGSLRQLEGCFEVGRSVLASWHLTVLLDVNKPTPNCRGSEASDWPECFSYATTNCASLPVTRCQTTPISGQQFEWRCSNSVLSREQRNASSHIDYHEPWPLGPAVSCVRSPGTGMHDDDG